MSDCSKGSHQGPPTLAGCIWGGGRRGMKFVTLKLGDLFLTLWQSQFLLTLEKGVIFLTLKQGQLFFTLGQSQPNQGGGKRTMNFLP